MWLEPVCSWYVWECLSASHMRFVTQTITQTLVTTSEKMSLLLNKIIIFVFLRLALLVTSSHHCLFSEPFVLRRYFLVLLDDDFSTELCELVLSCGSSWWSIWVWYSDIPDKGGIDRALFWYLQLPGDRISSKIFNRDLLTRFVIQVYGNSLFFYCLAGIKIPFISQCRVNSNLPCTTQW